MQPPLLTARSSPNGGGSGGECTLWCADSATAVALAVSEIGLRPPAPAETARGDEAALVSLAPSMHRHLVVAGRATAARSTVPTGVALRGGAPATITGTWASYEAMVAAKWAPLPAAGAAGGGRTAAAAYRPSGATAEAADAARLEAVMRGQGKVMVEVPVCYVNGIR